MKIKEITIKKIEKLPAHILVRVSELIDLIADKEHETVSPGDNEKDRARLREMRNKSRIILSGLKGKLSDDIIRFEREDRV